MKNVISTIAGIAMFAAFGAQAEPVTSVNVVGLTKISVPGTNTLIGKVTMAATPFVKVGTGKNLDVSTLDEVVGSNGLVAASTVNAADKIILWSGTAYLTAFLCNSAWESEFPGTANKWCYMAFDPVYTDIRPYPCSGTNIFNLWTGRGFWIRNVHADTTITLAGEVPTLGTNDIAIGSALTMVAYPYPVDAVVATIISTNDGAHAAATLNTADQILVWQGSSYKTYFLCNNAWESEFAGTAGKWCYMEFDPVYTDIRPYVATNAVMKPGDGFWYRSRGGSFTWPVSKPYTIGN